jgi:signal transduction histidine kinase
VLPPSTENFEIIRDEASRLEHLVDDLRTLSLADAGELSFAPQPVAAENLLREVRSMYQYRAQQQGIALEQHVEPGLPPLQVDAGRMTQVLTNILDNALRHMPDSGTGTHSAGKVVLAATRAEDAVELSIQDSGPGVGADDLERIFDRFYRADSSRQRDGGSGLGLAIAKSIVEMHGGQIRASSAPGEGLTISILLPALET